MAELGYTSLAELEVLVTRAVLPWHVDYEEGWKPTPLHEAIALLDERQGLSRP